MANVSGKSKKNGRNEKKCKAYKLASQREKNKLRGVLRHMRTHAMCPDLKKTLDRLTAQLSVADHRPILAEFGMTREDLNAA